MKTFSKLHSLSLKRFSLISFDDANVLSVYVHINSFVTVFHATYCYFDINQNLKKRVIRYEKRRFSFKKQRFFLLFYLMFYSSIHAPPMALAE